MPTGIRIALLLTVLAGRWLKRKSPAALSWWAQAAINFVACALVSLAGLWFFGRDGKMATYAAIVAGCALTLWWRGFGPGRK